MQKKKSSITRNLKVGDLVYHLLYGKEWVGILLEIIDVHDCEDKRAGSRRKMALVQMQPGTKFESFFSKKVSIRNRITDSMGLVSANWLFKLEKRKKK